MKGLLLLSIALSALGLLIFETSFAFKSPKDFNFPEKSIWIHKGGRPENRLQGIKSSYLEGAKGFELDVVYASKPKEFILSHEANADDFDGKEGLEGVLKYLSGVEKKVYLWLDMKNLSKENIFEAGAALESLLARYKLLDSTLIESSNYSEIFYLSNKTKLNCIYWMYPTDSYISRKRFSHIWRVLNGNFVGISMPKETFSEKVSERYSQFPLLVFTVNERKKIQYIQTFKNVKVVLSDHVF